MSLMSFISKQFIDIIQWTEDEPGTLAYRYPMQDMEIQNGGKLVVRETQRAAFFNEGKFADQFGAGTYTLNTKTLPVLTYLQNWDKLFESPFKSDVYFFSLREQIDQKWGTNQPITIRDKEYGPLRIRAHGIYSYKIADIVTFWTKLCGTAERYTVQDVEGQIRAAVLTSLASFLGKQRCGVRGHGGEPGAVLPEAVGSGQNHLQRFRPGAEEFLCAERFPAGGAAAASGQGLFHAAGRRPAEICPAAGGGQHRHCRSQPERRGRRGCRHRCRHRPGPDDGGDDGPSRRNISPQAHSRQHAAEDPLQTLEKLADLLKKGILTQAEFDAKKTELLKKIQ